MKALYKNRLCTVVDIASDVRLAGDEGEFRVPLYDEGLVIDPTDEEVAAADNFREWFGLDEQDTKDTRAMLRGELPVGEWQARKQG